MYRKAKAIFFSITYCICGQEYYEPVSCGSIMKLYSGRHFQPLCMSGVPQDDEGIIKKSESNQNVIIFGYSFAELQGSKPRFFILFRQSPVLNKVPEPCLYPVDQQRGPYDRGVRAGMHKKPHDPWHGAVKPDRDAVCRLMGKTGEELHSMKYWGGFPWTRCPHPMDGYPMERGFSTGMHETAETVGDMPGRTFLVSCTPLFDAEETFSGFPLGNEL